MNPLELAIEKLEQKFDWYFTGCNREHIIITKNGEGTFLAEVTKEFIITIAESINDY